MRKITLLLILCSIFFISGCEKDTVVRNPYLPERGFRTDLNLNLPLYGGLTTTANALYVNSPGAGLRGFFVINTGFNNFYAWEAACPNQTLNSCSTMKIKAATSVVCSCEDYSYNLFNGQLTTPLENSKQKIYPLLQYSARFNASSGILTISN